MPKRLRKKNTENKVIIKDIIISPVGGDRGSVDMNAENLTA